MKNWKKALIVFVLVALIIFLFNSVIMPWYVKHNTLVKVPSVVGLSFANAKKVLEEAGLEGKQGDIRYDATKPIGTVLDQIPPAEQIVKDGRRIYLVVSGGEQLYDVPNLVGRTVREAKFTLGQRNLELLEVSTKQSAQYPSGIIITQVEQPGSKVKKGAKIAVVVSLGMEQGDVKIPDLVGKNLEEAKKIILQYKFTIGKINYQPSTTVPLNAVIDQYPKANTMAKENQRIDLFVNKEVKPKVQPKDEEMNAMEEVKPEKDNKEEKPKDSEKPKELDKEKKDQKEKTTDTKKEDKKKSDQPKEKEKKDTDKKDSDKKDDGGTKF